MHVGGYGFQIEMNYRLVKQGARIKGAPSLLPGRTHGTSKLTLRIGLGALWIVWRLCIADLIGHL